MALPLIPIAVGLIGGGYFLSSGAKAVEKTTDLTREITNLALVAGVSYVALKAMKVI